jgi:hypothetical protein
VRCLNAESITCYLSHIIACSLDNHCLRMAITISIIASEHQSFDCNLCTITYEYESFSTSRMRERRHSSSLISLDGREHSCETARCTLPMSSDAESLRTPGRTGGWQGMRTAQHSSFKSARYSASSQLARRYGGQTS